MKTTICGKCNRPLSAGDYSPCDPCRRLRQSAWYERKKASIQFRRKKAAYLRDWRKRNPGYSGRKTPQRVDPVAQKRYRAKYRARPGGREHENEQSRAYYARHREQILAQKKLTKLARVQIP